MLSRLSAFLLFALLLVVLAACDEDDAPDPTTAINSPATSATAAETRATAAPTVAATAAPRGSGVAIVDELIAAVAAKDAPKLAARLQFWSRPCTEPQGIGAVACPTGSPIGTLVMGIGSGNCEGTFLKPGDPVIATTTQNFVNRATRLHSVVKAPPFPARAGVTNVPGRYQVVFEPGIALSVDDQGITYFILGCGGESAAALVASGRFGATPEYLVPPR